jgi:dipeptidyl aminopeptidase/acylaminoacyl peptidase
MKRIITSISVVSLLLIMAGCATTKVATDTTTATSTTAKELNTQDSTIPASQKTDAVELTEEDKEYARSTNQMTNTVTKEVFSEDKKEILDIIAKLDSIMKNYDYTSWITYVDEESRVYWENRKNLHKASTRLPVKGLQLNSLEDYFKFVFIQSRIGREVDEIRYISDKSVKAVQVKDDQDIVYYYFQKVDDKWQLHLPPLDD